MKDKKANPVGRPKLPKGHVKGQMLRMRINESDLRLFTKAAQANNQTLSEWVWDRLRESIQN